MIKLHFFTKTASQQRRLRALFRVLFVVLVVHTVLVYAVADFPMLARGSWGWLLSGAPRMFERKRKIVIKRDGRLYLWAGENDSDHFDITAFRLDPDRLHYGLGRERFEALIEPEFVTVQEADESIDDSQRVLVVKVGGEVKVYPLNVLRRHEVVNDVVGGRPIFASYCVLADLGAVYDRQIDGQTHTFAVSGYTYSAPGIWDERDAFVLWDRDSESLWWPLMGTAVSGPMIDTPLKVLERELWAQTTWEAIKDQYPDAQVLKPGQEMDPPSDQFLMMAAEPTSPPARAPMNTSSSESLTDESIAPHWGDNPTLGSPDVPGD